MKKTSNRDLFIALALVPLVQLGYTYYISIQSIGVLFLAKKTLHKKIPKAIWLPGVIGGCIFSLKIIFTLKNIDHAELLLTLREAFCFYIIIFSTHWITQDLKKSNPSEIIASGKIPYFFILISAVVVFFQEIYIKNGIFLSIPLDWFIANADTLSGVESALEHQTRLRPVGFYGEPSYMAFVLMSALTMLICSESKNHIIATGILAAIVSLSILKSLSGFLSFAAIILVYIATTRKINFASKLIAIIFSAFIFSVTLGFSDTEVSDRITNILAGNVDSSTFVRYIFPAITVESMLEQGDLIGYSGYRILEIARNHGLNSIDNALFYLMLRYGIFCPVILAIILYRFRNPLVITYALLALNFNGAYLSFDKALIISLTAGISLHLLNKKKARSYAEQ